METCEESRLTYDQMRARDPRAAGLVERAVGCDGDQWDLYYTRLANGGWNAYDDRGRQVLYYDPTYEEWGDA